jgi:excinuclease ABC subunit B
VSLVAILDADKEGFLRGQTALIQTIGRAARNANGRVIMYGDRETEAIRAAMAETRRRREIQIRYNEEHGITPETIVKGVSDIAEFLSLESPTVPAGRRGRRQVAEGLDRDALQRLSVELEEAMFLAADELRFEEAARLRDELKTVRRDLASA